MPRANSSSVCRVGLISDTHGLLRPEAIEALRGSDHIVHAGDIGDPGILEALARLAPLTVVRGNNDHGPWADAIPHSALLRAGGKAIYVIHDLVQLSLHPNANGIDVVVSGHSHRPAIEWRDGVLYVNPGSAGPRRFNLPISVGLVLVAGDAVTPHLLELTPD